MKCQKCGAEVFMPFKCLYCGGCFCAEHRLPENHECLEIAAARSAKSSAQQIVTQTTKSFNYTVTYPRQWQNKGALYFSRKEVLHLAAAALLVVAVGMSIKGYPFFLYGGDRAEYIQLTLFTAIFTASFFIHEIAHKSVAQKYGLWAEFRMTTIGAVLTLISLFSPIKLISPGAVMISGHADGQTIGRISVAGPLTNIALSVGFLAALLITPAAYVEPLALGAAFNAWIALFNLIPYGVFDGLKVLHWDKRVWAACFAASLALTLASYGLVS